MFLDQEQNIANAPRLILMRCYWLDSVKLGSEREKLKENGGIDREGLQAWLRNVEGSA